MKRAFLYLLFLGLVVLPGGCKPRSDHIILRIAHSLPQTHPVHKAMEFMAEQLRQKSHGQVELKIYANSELGSEREIIELVQLGAIDMVKTSTSPLEGFVPVMAIFGVPYVFRDEDQYWRVLEGPIGQRLLAASESKGLKGLCYYDAGSRSFYTKPRPIQRPEDLRGLKIRVQNSKTAVDMVKAMGGSPTPLSFGELYSALEQGVVDGAENNAPSFLSSRHYEICKYYSLDEHTRVPDIILISTATWKRLSPEVRKMVQEAATASAHFQRKLWAEKTREALKTVSDAGVQIIHPEKKPFQDAVQSMYREYEGTETGKYINLIMAIE